MARGLLLSRRTKLIAASGIIPNGLWVADSGLTDGTAILSVVDSSGHSRTMTQATSGNRPTKQTVNGVPVMRFASASSQFLATATPVTTAVDNWAMYVVAEVSDATAGHAQFSNGNGDGYGIVAASGQGGGTGRVAALLQGVEWMTSGTSTPSAGTFAIYLLRRSGGTTKLYMNGGAALMSTATAPGTPTSGTFLGSIQGTFFHQGDVVRAAIYDPAPSVVDINTILSAVAATYPTLGLAWANIS